MEDMILEYSGGKIAAGAGQTEKVLAEGVGFSVAKGQSLALIGETGSGKTMTALSIMGLLPSGVSEKGGSMVFMGKKMESPSAVRELLGRKIVYIPQSGAESLDPSRKVKKQLYDSLKRAGASGLKKNSGRASLKDRALAKLALSGFEDPAAIMDRYPFQLSGGMAQRVTIALAACSDAKLIIADEPSNGLDDDFAEDFLSLVRSVFPDAAVLMITHDISMASQCGNIVVLCGGKVMEKGPAAEILAHPAHPYTKALIGALPANGMVRTPVLRQGKSDCPFFGRCPEGCEACLGEIPVTADGGRSRRCVL